MPVRSHLQFAAFTLATAGLVGASVWWIREDAHGRAALQVGLDDPAPLRGGRRWFVDVADPAGVAITHVSGADGQFLFPEIMCGGAAFFDFDRDDELDLYLVQGGSADPSRAAAAGNRLLRNLGDGTFEDVTASAGAGDTGYGMGCAVGDVDRDGDLDLFVTNVGDDVLYRNNGDGTFADVTVTAGVGGDAWSAGATFLDYDDDGHLDLFVVRYVAWSYATETVCTSPYGDRQYCGPLTYDTPLADTLFRNRGDGTFEDVSAAVGLAAAVGNGLGVVTADFDGNGAIDIYVANDGMPNRMWLNDGAGTFRNDADRLGCAVNDDGEPEAGMGILAFDAEDDGDLDLFLTHLSRESNTLYVADHGLFEDRSRDCGLGSPSLPFTGFGTAAADFDHDGHLDLYVANGRVRLPTAFIARRDQHAEPNQLFRGLGSGLFDEVFPRGGTVPAIVATSRGVAIGDYDGDGDMDLVVVDRDAPVRVLRNARGAAGRWVMFDVRDRRGHEALGAVVGVVAEGRTRWRLVQRGGGYLASHDPRVHVGLGLEGSIGDVRVRWLDGTMESFGPRQPGAVHRLERGSGVDVGARAGSR